MFMLAINRLIISIDYYCIYNVIIIVNLIIMIIVSPLIFDYRNYRITFSGGSAFFRNRGFYGIVSRPLAGIKAPGQAPALYSAGACIHVNLFL